MVYLNPRQRIIVLIFKIEDKNNPSIYKTTIIRPLLAKLYGILLENKIMIWIESQGREQYEMAKFPLMRRVGFRQATMIRV